MPRRAPQVLLGLARRGAAWMPRVGRRAGSPLYRPPTKPRSAGSSGNRAAFSLDTFFWRRKRKYLAFGCDNPIQTNVAIATALFIVYKWLLLINISELFSI